MLVRGDVVLELVGFKEAAQLVDVALVQLVHLLLRGLWSLLHLDGLPHCKTQRGAVGQSRGPWGREVLLLLFLSTLFQVMNPKTLEQLQDSLRYNDNTTSWHCKIPRNVLGALHALSPLILVTIIWE